MVRVRGQGQKVRVRRSGVRRSGYWATITFAYDKVFYITICYLKYMEI
jgi:hypothetical protein